jgi:hypothetical protein
MRQKQENRDVLVAGLVTKRQKEKFDSYCWSHRTTRSELIRGFIENLLEIKS